MNDMGHMSNTNIGQEVGTVKWATTDPLDAIVARRGEDQLGFRASFGGVEYVHTSSPVAVDRITKKEEKKARKAGFQLMVDPEAKQSPELLYQWELEVDEDLRIGGAVENGFDNTFYRWHEDQGGACYWQSQKDEHSINHALGWLRDYQTDKYSKDKAEKMVDTARAGMLLDRRQVLTQQDDSREIVMGLQGAYLHIDRKTGKITAKAPNKALGLTSCIPSRFDWERVDEEDGSYIPRSADPQSYFGRYLDIFFPDPDVRDLLQEAVASSFLPICFEKIFVLYGDGSNGKSTLLHLLRALHPAPSNVAMDIAGLAGEYGIQDFLGARIAICTECPKHIDDVQASRLKALSSWDPVPLNRKYRDRVTIVARTTLFMATNFHITFNDHSYGMKRRMMIIPFSVRLKEGDPRRIQDYHKLITDSPVEMAQVLDWLLQGAARLIQRGALPDAPEAVVQITQAAEQHTNPVSAFLSEEEAIVSADHWTEKQEIYDTFVDYCKRNGNKEWSAQKFWEQVRATFHNTPYEEKQITTKDRKVKRHVSMRFATIRFTTARSIQQIKLEEKVIAARVEKIFNNQVPEEAA